MSGRSEEDNGLGLEVTTQKKKKKKGKKPDEQEIAAVVLAPAKPRERSRRGHTAPEPVVSDEEIDVESFLASIGTKWTEMPTGTKFVDKESMKKLVKAIHTHLTEANEEHSVTYGNFLERGLADYKAPSTGSDVLRFKETYGMNFSKHVAEYDKWIVSVLPSNHHKLDWWLGTTPVGRGIPEMMPKSDLNKKALFIKWSEAAHRDENVRFYLGVRALDDIFKGEVARDEMEGMIRYVAKFIWLYENNIDGYGCVNIKGPDKKKLDADYESALEAVGVSIMKKKKKVTIVEAKEALLTPIEEEFAAEKKARECRLELMKAVAVQKATTTGVSSWFKRAVKIGSSSSSSSSSGKKTTDGSSGKKKKSATAKTAVRTGR